MRVRLRPLSRRNANGPSFRREFDAAQRGGAHGFDLVGQALTVRVLADPDAWLAREDDRGRLADYVARGAVSSVVRLLVLRVRHVLRAVPPRRRYGSFARGVARAVRDAQMRTASIWPLDAVNETV